MKGSTEDGIKLDNGSVEAAANGHAADVKPEPKAEVRTAITEPSSAVVELPASRCTHINRCTTVS